MAEDQGQRRELVNKMKKILEQQRGQSDQEQPQTPVAPTPAPTPAEPEADEIQELRKRLTDGLANGLSSRQCMLLLEELLQKAPSPKAELQNAIQVALCCKDRAVFVKQALANHGDKIDDLQKMTKEIARKVWEAGQFEHARNYSKQILEEEPDNTEFLWLFCMATMKLNREDQIENCDILVTGLPEFNQLMTLLGKRDAPRKAQIQKLIEKQRARLTRLQQEQELARKREEMERKQREAVYEEARLQVGTKARKDRKCSLLVFISAILVALLGLLAVLRPFILGGGAQSAAPNITSLVILLVGIVVAIVIGMNLFRKPAKYYEMANRFLAAGNYLGAARAFGSAGNYGDAKQKFQIAWEKRTPRVSVCVGKFHTIALKKNGMILTTGKNENGQCSVATWMDILSVAAGGEHSVGLTVDGTVMTAGSNLQGQCDVQNWTNIVAVSAGFVHTVGLREDGTVVAVGANKYGQCNTAGWKNVVAISAGTSHTVGLRIDGTVVATGKNDKGQCNVSHWTDIVAVSAGGIHTVGIKADGTVVAAGENYWGQCNVERWRDIMAVFAAGYRTIGLKADGTLVGTGWDAGGTYKVPNWTDVVAIGAGDSHTVGLRSDGTVVAEGSDELGQCAVEDWEEIRLPG